MIGRNHISVNIEASQIRERNKELAILLEISNLFSTAHSLNQVLDVGLSKIMQYFNYDAGRIYLKDDGVEVLRLAAGKGIDGEEFKTVSLFSSFSGKAFRTQSLVAQHVSELADQRRSELLKKLGFEFILCVPLVAMDSVIGVMNLSTRTPVQLRQQDIDLLIAMGNLIAIAVNNVQCYQEVHDRLKEVEAKNHLIKFFAYSCFHDLKNPIIGLHGMARFLLKRYGHVLDDEGRYYCDRILNTTEHLEKLVDKINDYVKAKESPLNFETVKITEITDFARKEFSSSVAARHIRWSEPTISPDMVVDKLSLSRVLINLIDNALKYGGDNLTQIAIGYQDTLTHHIVSVFNDGNGIAEEETEKLFDPFHRSEKSRGTEGSGLGLAIIKAIAERHGGTVWVLSGEEKGVTFYVSILKNLEGNKSDRVA